MLIRTEKPIDRVFATAEVVFIAALAASRLFTYVGDYGRAINSFREVQVRTVSQSRLSQAKRIVFQDMASAGAQACSVHTADA
jgi:hypothetical protein